MTMSHKEALDLVMGVGPWPNDYDGTAKRLSAYLDARGLVMVPREMTTPMIEVFYKNNRLAAAWSAMLAAAPDPFGDE